MDEADQGQDYQARLNADAIRTHQARSVAAAFHGAALCVDCGAPIPEERRATVPGARRCVDCQAQEERLEKRD